MTTSDDIVFAARDWIETPYAHQHSTKGAGCDCLGLVRGVYREIEGDEPETIPNYSIAWGEVGHNEPLIEAASRHLNRVDIDQMSAGDVIIFRMKRGAVAKHCGIVATDTTFVHAYQGAGRVLESPLVNYWQSRIVAVFRFPGVM